MGFEDGKRKIKQTTWRRNVSMSAINILLSFANYQHFINEATLYGPWPTMCTRKMITCLFILWLNHHPITMDLQDDRYMDTYLIVAPRASIPARICFFRLIWCVCVFVKRRWSHHFHQMSLSYSPLLSSHSIYTYLYVSIGIAPKRTKRQQQRRFIIGNIEKPQVVRSLWSWKKKKENACDICTNGVRVCVCVCLLLHTVQMNK